jgi:hypothetical protein
MTTEQELRDRARQAWIDATIENMGAENVFTRGFLAAGRPAPGVTIAEYEVDLGMVEGVPQRARLAAVPQKEGPTLWAVRRHGECLNMQAEWERQPPHG